MKTKNKKNNLGEKGITLIALVVTIVVLLILAGVSINALFGNNGIIEKAKEAQNAMTVATEKDQISLALTEWELTNKTEKTTFEKFMKGKFGEDNVETVTENEVIVTMESANRYRVKTDGTITSTKGVSINKSSLTLKLQEGKTVTETLTASLSEITGEITWSNSDNSKVTISATKGTSITVTAKAVGETTLIATCGDYTATCTVKVTKPATVSTGAFVEYNVAYKDVHKGYDYTTINGWRLLDYTKNEDGTYSNVKLISTGIPARLHYDDYDTTNDSWYVKDSTTLTRFKSVLGSDYTYYTGTDTYYGLQASAGMYYNFGNIKFAYGTNSRGGNLGYFTEITSNGTKYNSTNTTETTGSNLFIPTGVNASVRLLTLPEMNKMLGRTDIDSKTKMTDPTGVNGLFVLQNIKNITGMDSYAYELVSFWLASPSPETRYGTGGVTVVCDGSIGTGRGDSGVRPVVTLKFNTILTDENGDGVLEIQQ